MTSANNFLETFWNIVAECDADLDQLQSLLNLQSQTNLILYVQTYQQLTEELYNSGVAEMLYTRGLSDDAVEDTITHIVSQGKLFYEQVLENPSLAPEGEFIKALRFPGMARILLQKKFGVDAVDFLN